MVLMAMWKSEAWVFKKLECKWWYPKTDKYMMADMGANRKHRSKSRRVVNGKTVERLGKLDNIGEWLPNEINGRINVVGVSVSVDECVISKKRH